MYIVQSMYMIIGISWVCIYQIYQTPLQEYFFVPYTFTDVNDEREIHKGDEVSFYMAKNKRSVSTW